MQDRVAALENIVLLSIWLFIPKLFFHSSNNHVFYEPNKHNPFDEHRAYLCRVEVVIFQAIQNMCFNPLDGKQHEDKFHTSAKYCLNTLS